MTATSEYKNKDKASILIVGSDIGLQENGEFYFKRALEAFGHRIEEFDYKKSTFLNERIFSGVKRLIRSAAIAIREDFPVLSRIDRGRSNKVLLNFVLKKNVDLVIVFKGELISADTLFQIKKRKKNVLLVNWLTDFPLTILSEDVYPVYDCIFLPFPNYVEALYKKGARRVEHLPYGCDPQIHLKQELSEQDKVKYGRDICFVGSWYPNREELFEEIADFDLGIWGNFWDKVKLGSKLRSHIEGRWLGAGEWTKVYSGSKICLNLHREDFRMGGGTIMRTFEALSCGIFLLTEETDDIRNLFRPGEDLVCFKTKEELRQLIKYYLVNEEDRKKIALHGQKTVREKHTYIHRMKKLLSVVEELKKGLRDGNYS